MRGLPVPPAAGDHDADRALAERYAEGDPFAIRNVDDWIEVVLHRHFRSLQSDWEDLRQEIRLRVLDNVRRKRFEGRSSLRTYVHGIARNAGIDQLIGSRIGRNSLHAANGLSADN